MLLTMTYEHQEKDSEEESDGRRKAGREMTRCDEHGVILTAKVEVGKTADARQEAKTENERMRR